MSAKPNTVIIAAANEIYNGEERDYTKAIATEIMAQGMREDTDYLTFKVLPKDWAQTGNEFGRAGPARALPTNDADYAKVPGFSPYILDELRAARDITILGAGHSTLDATARLRQERFDADANYVTHLVDDLPHLTKIYQNRVRVFAPMSQENLEAISRAIAPSTRSVQLDSVPHTNSLNLCEPELEAMLQGKNGKKIAKILGSGEKFAVVIINGGFEAGPNGEYVPYMAAEARANGAALGAVLPKGTHLIAVQCGPRNLRDEFPSAEKQDTHKSQHTMRAFTASYRAAQESDEAPLSRSTVKVRLDPRTIKRVNVVEERYVPLSYNPGKAAFIMGRNPNCVAFITDSSAFGTMHGALINVPRENKLLGMFSFAAQKIDHTGRHEAYLHQYNNYGISILHPVDGVDGFIEEKSPRPISNPPEFRNAAEQIVNTLKLAKPKF